MSSSDYATDGALGVSSQGLNPFIQPGLMNQLASPTDISTNVAGNLIASCEDTNASSPNKRYFIDDASGAANYYSFNGSTITKVKTGTGTGTTYVAGKTDFISFNGFFYGSSSTVLNKWDGTSGAGLTEAFQTFGDGSAHHPMIVYQGFLFIGDGNTLSTLSSGGSYSTSVLTLSAKEKIVALGIDPATGLMMISIQTVYDVSDTVPSLKAVYLYDGISAKPTRKILVDDLICAFYNVEGNVYIGAGQTLGVWNGNGVTFLRKLKNVTLNNTDLPYKHHFTNIRNVLLVVDGAMILAYGAVTTNKKAFFYTGIPNAGSTNHFSIVAPGGSNTFIAGYATNTVLQWDLSSSSAGNLTLYFNNIYFPRPVYIRRMRVITTGIATTSGGGIGIATINDEKSRQITTTALTFVVTAAMVTNHANYVFDFDYTNLKLQGMQPRINMDTQAVGIVRVIIYYDIAE